MDRFDINAPGEVERRQKIAAARTMHGHMRHYRNGQIKAVCRRLQSECELLTGIQSMSLSCVPFMKVLSSGVID